MTRNVIYFFFLFIGLVIAQVVIFNRIWLFNTAMPLVFIYFFISLPINTNIKLVLTLSFLLGFTVDIFSDTPGLNTLCCTISAALRRPILRLYLPREEDMTGSIPSPKSMDRAPYMKYLITLTVLYCLLFFIILSFDFFNLWRLITRTIASSALTFIILLAFSNIFVPKLENRK